MTKRNNRGQFTGGASGNPSGRPPGSGHAAKLRRAISEDMDAIISVLVKQAKDGDTGAAKLLLDRAIPAIKPQAQVVTVPGLDADGVSDRARAALDAAGRGELPPDTAAQLVQAVGSLARVVEIDDIEKRLHTHE
ncbi:DUF5681 domain-containing protein [Salinisphaera orenii]|uniref:DUF5681 domain-containing protein n=1 Tax=Salinisphaera orenii TaxID=856731 RepID=UPI0013A601F9